MKPKYIKISLKLDEDFDNAAFEKLIDIKPIRRASFIRMWINEFLSNNSNTKPVEIKEIPKVINENQNSKRDKKKEISDLLSDFD